MAFKKEALSNEVLSFGEAPLWDHRRQKLVVSDCFVKCVCLFDPKTKEFSKKCVPVDKECKYFSIGMPCENLEGSNTVNPNFIVSANKLTKFNWETEETKVVADFKTEEDGKRGNHTYSDGKCDAKGRLHIGTYVLAASSFDGAFESFCEPNIGIIHQYEEVGNTVVRKEAAGGYDAPNGLGWNKENTHFYMCDISQRVVNVYDFNLESGTLENKRIFFDFNKNEDVKGFPDGLTVDTSGNIWVACWKAGSVIKIDGNTGKLLETVKFPTINTTSLCFGGDAYESLFVTTAKAELNGDILELHPDAGKIFRITSPKDNSFKGFQQYFAKM